jgi:hypothetical protein
MRPPFAPVDLPTRAAPPLDEGSGRLRAPQSHAADLELARTVVAAPLAPLRFVASQLILAVAPLAGLLGFDELGRLAAELEGRPCEQAPPVHRPAP